MNEYGFPTSASGSFREVVEAMVDDLLAREVVRGHSDHLNSEVSSRVAEELTVQALSSGRLTMKPDITGQRASGGNTAMWVQRLVCSIPFMLKVDMDKKLVREAKKLQRLQEREDLAPAFKQCFPQVFALSEAPPVFGYIMEYFRPEEGYASVADLLYEVGGDALSELEAIRVANALCDALFSGYSSSRTTRLRPSIAADYVDRIRQRLRDAKGQDSAFEPVPVTVPPHGRTYRPWSVYLDALDRNRQSLEALSPPFVSFVHGDPNPGNVLVRTVPDGPVGVRFIDPKEWHDGDYLFDMTKFTHYLLVTGPVERPGLEQPPVVEQNGQVVIEHLCQPSSADTAMEQAVRERVQQFAGDCGDDHWELRWKLGMASNLLGLPTGRLEKGRRGSALALYAEGLRHLHDFCESCGLIDA